MLNVNYDEEKDTLSVRPANGVLMLIQKVIEVYVFDESTMTNRCVDTPERAASAIGN